LGFQFAVVEVVVTSIQDGFPNWIKRHLLCHEVLVLLICVVSFLFGLPNITQVERHSSRYLLRVYILKLLSLTNFSTASGRYLFLPTDRSLCRIVVYHVFGILRSNCHLVVLRRATAMQ